MSRVEVNVTEGELSGIVEKGVYDDRYIAFRGIPYATPPIGDLRFQDPLPPKPWSGVRDASKFGNSPVQMNWEKEMDGDEDCLFLNVYTPDIKSKGKYPVMVYVGSGGFFIDYGEKLRVGPDYLIKKEIVLVTLNYRLGVLGFLNFDHEKASGNQGLKDVLMALRWVQQNISEFGGNPQNVTMFGNGAGSAIIHFIALSPYTKGLFHKVIAQSGVATCPWILTKTEAIIEKGLALAEKLGKATTDTNVACEFLKTIDARKLRSCEREVEANLEYPPYTLTFTISIDNKSRHPFFQKHPNEYIHRGIRLPFLLGYNTREAGFILRSNFYPHISKESLKRVNSDFKIGMYADTAFNVMPQAGVTPRKVKSIYFGARAVSERTIKNYADFLTDVHMVRGITEVLDTQMKKGGTTYMYKFSYDSPTTLIKNIFNINIAGPVHLEDMCYLLHPQVIDDFGLNLPPPNSEDYKMIDRMTQMWTDFAKTGNPTPAITYLNPVEWKPVKTGNVYDYLNINIKPCMETICKGKERWDWRKRTLDCFNIFKLF